MCANDAEAKRAAQELVSVGLCTALKALSDLPPDPLTLLCLLTDAQLRTLLGGRLGGNPKACANRPALVQAIGEAARAKAQTPSKSADGAGASSGSHGKNKGDKKVLTQTTLTGSTSANRLPTALVEMLKTSMCVRLSDKTERSLHRYVLVPRYVACSSHNIRAKCLVSFGGLE